MSTTTANHFETRSELNYPLPTILVPTSLLDQRTAERKGRRDWRVAFDKAGMCPYLSTLYGATGQQAMRLSEYLRDRVAAIDKQVAAHQQELKILASHGQGEDAPPSPGPGASHRARATARRAERSRLAAAAAAAARAQALNIAIAELMQQRRHVHEQARDCLLQLCAKFQTLAASYRQGVEAGPWWRRLFGKRRAVAEPLPVFVADIDWATGDLPMMEVVIDAADSPKLRWQYHPFLTATA